MPRAIDKMKDLEQRVLWLEQKVERLEKRPIAGRYPSRLIEAVKWLERRGGGEISKIMLDGEKHGFSGALVRKAKRYLEWERIGNRWVA